VALQRIAALQSGFAVPELGSLSLAALALLAGWTLRRARRQVQTCA